MNGLRLALLLALWMASAASAQQRFIDIAIPLRSEPGYSSIILKNGIRSGMEVLLIETSGSWSRVLLDDTEGWVPSQFLSSSQQQEHPRIAQAEAMLASVRDSLRNCLAEVDAQDAARSRLNVLEQELQRVRTLAASQLQLDQQNTELYKTTQQLQNDLNVLQAENEALRKREWRDWFFYGSVTTAVGLFLGIMGAGLSGRKRRPEWID